MRPRRRLEATEPMGEMFLAHRGRISDVDFHPEGHLLGSVGADSTFKVWGQCFPDTDFENRFEVRQLPHQKQRDIVLSWSASEHDTSFDGTDPWQTYVSSTDISKRFPPPPVGSTIPFF